jgi:hypothetical protein
MGRLHTISAPSPALYATGDRPPVSNAYFAVTVDAAVDLPRRASTRACPARSGCRRRWPSSRGS